MSFPMGFCIEHTAGGGIMDTAETQLIYFPIAPVPEEKDEIPPSQPRSPVKFPDQNDFEFPVEPKVGSVFWHLGK